MFSIKSRSLLLLLLLLGGKFASSFHLPGKKENSNCRMLNKSEKNVSCGEPFTCTRKIGSRGLTRAISQANTALKVSPGGATDGGGVTTNYGITKASIVVGVVTAAMGYLYGKVLSFCVRTVWHTLPMIFQDKNLNPTYFITGLCTFGGLLMGILSSALSSSTFTVADFVSLFSSSNCKSLPSTRIYLLPLLLLSLVTSTFGFSVGPEAPMVCAGALIGASIARSIYGNDNDDSSIDNQEILAYAGASGALTAFMGIPVAGSIFALELTSSHAGMNKAGGKQALSSTIMSSIAALVVIQAIFDPSSAVGGHFDYGTVGVLTGRTMIATALVCGAGGGLLGTVFQALVGAIKKVSWKTNTGPKNSPKKQYWQRQIIVKTIIGFLVGIISSNYPQTLFWGEGSLQTVINGQHTPFINTKHGLSQILTSAARVNPNLPFESAAAAAQVGVAKLVAIALACAGKFPGGIIFPLMFAAAPLAHSISSLLSMHSGLVPLVVMCLMASTQAAVTRTPLATVLILSLTASAKTELSVMLPGMILSSYLGVYFSRLFSEKSYFAYNE